MKSLANRFWNDESGQGLTEYVLIIALVAVGLIAVMGLFRDELGRVFDTAIDELETAQSQQYESSNGGAGS
jgi:pilus assembly protein Flp/PilA